MKKLIAVSRAKTILRGIIILAVKSSLLVSFSLKAQPSVDSDALRQTTTISPLASRSLLMDITEVGDKLLAVGERGHILISHDNANSWTQVENVPVRVTLTASFFVDEQWGWAVGHDGVVLRSADGGETWLKLLDGYQANQLVLDHVNRLISVEEQQLAQATAQEMVTSQEQLDALIYFRDDAESFVDEGATRPFLDVWFKNPNEGIIVGGYGLILHTDNGGDSWTPAFNGLDNPEAFHLNKVVNIGEDLFLAGEAGVLYRSHDWGKNWQQLDSPYQGSFFGLVGTDNRTIFAYGLRGNIFLSNNRGDSWVKINIGVKASLFGATSMRDGNTVLVGAGGVIVTLDGQGNVLNISQSSSKLPLSSVIEANHGLITVGLNGVEPLPLTILATAKSTSRGLKDD